MDLLIYYEESAADILVILVPAMYEVSVANVPCLGTLLRRRMSAVCFVRTLIVLLFSSGSRPHSASSDKLLD